MTGKCTVVAEGLFYVTCVSQPTDPGVHEFRSVNSSGNGVHWNEPGRCSPVRSWTLVQSFYSGHRQILLLVQTPELIYFFARQQYQSASASPPICALSTAVITGSFMNSRCWALTVYSEFTPCHRLKSWLI